MTYGEEKLAIQFLMQLMSEITVSWWSHVDTARQIRMVLCNLITPMLIQDHC